MLLLQICHFQFKLTARSDLSLLGGSFWCYAQRMQSSNFFSRRCSAQSGKLKWLYDGSKHLKYESVLPVYFGFQLYLALEKRSCTPKDKSKCQLKEWHHCLGKGVSIWLQRPNSSYNLGFLSRDANIFHIIWHHLLEALQRVLCNSTCVNDCFHLC